MISQYIIIGLTIYRRIDFGGDQTDMERGMANNLLGQDVRRTPWCLCLFVCICAKLLPRVICPNMVRRIPTWLWYWSPQPPPQYQKKKSVQTFGAAYYPAFTVVICYFSSLQDTKVKIFWRYFSRRSCTQYRQFDSTYVSCHSYNTNTGYGEFRGSVK